ncbi:hypothetical protein EIP91_009517 [Steccherinum ochraceum]|uniref:RNA-dependent RNA polymerase n=1 Tax=Steccherinum ochraceum TaxID=92696 RepID=A0A4R0RAZ6_9APHY|nr:hypothetical protein EIP91_009517 [Steccherinum ochraceum]
MDFDERFDRSELQGHLADIGFPDADMDDLLRRTTKNTRRGTEFSFKPYEVSIGVLSNGTFYSGFHSDVEREGVCIDSPKPLPSSVWIRFHEQLIMFRCFCTGNTVPGLNPYEGRLDFRDLVPGCIHLSARRVIQGQDAPVPLRHDHEVLVILGVTARRPPMYTLRLPHVLVVGSEPSFDRAGTEADFMNAVNEATAGPVRATGDPRLHVNPGLWTTHIFKFVLTRRQYKVLWMCMVILRLKGLRPRFERPLPLPAVLPLEEQVLAPLQNSGESNFATRYLMAGLLSHNIINVCDLEPLHIEIGHLSEERKCALLEGIFKTGLRGDIAQTIRAVSRCITPDSIPSHCFRIRRCLVTPLRCLLIAPVNETSNDLLRKYRKHVDRFLRVQFVDDRGDFPVKGETSAIDTFLNGQQGIFARIRRVLQHGIDIAQRHYVFLCFGESQGKARGFWAISEKPEDGFTVQNVIAGMGDLSRETIVAKHAARQGLLLSTTRAIQLDSEWRLENIEDIQRNGYVFTDGSGQCSQHIATVAAKTVGYDQEPSAIHVRLEGGTKGVLTVVQDIEKYTLRRRPSQIKFPSNNHTFSVIKVAGYAKATLNRQAIVLMESAGIPADILVEVFKIEKATIEGLGSTGTAFLPSKERLAQVSAFPLVEVLEAGFAEDAFIHDSIQVVKCRMLSDLRWKQWIEIADSAFLMGVADETNSLEEGQIFCQIHPPSKSAEVVKGNCTIYRNPCLHPGDVRLVEAVDCPKLRHLKNVIVFSTRGARPLPNMLAGGDLDGDFYSLIWDKRLLLMPELVHEPMDYTAAIPPRVPPPITIDQTKEHFLDYVKNDVLGRVCNTHLAFADQANEGPRSAECLRLAQLASDAVDFPKTGVPVLSNQIPVVRSYPDFMGKEAKSIRIFKKKDIKSYQSQRALGQMFRLIEKEPTFEQTSKTTRHIDPRLSQLEIPAQYGDVFMEAVALLKAQYEFELAGILRRYSITEAECVVGLLLRSPDTRLKVEKDYDLRIALREAYKELVTAVQGRTRDYITENPVVDGGAEDQRVWALAAYKISYDPDYAHFTDIDQTAVNGELGDLGGVGEDNDTDVEDEEIPDIETYWSFPWVYWRELSRMVQAR